MLGETLVTGALYPTQRLRRLSKPRVDLIGIAIDALPMNEAVRKISVWLDEPFKFCRYVVTPNVDHIVMLQHDEGLRSAYQDADLVLADGRPVVWASQFLRKPLPGRVAGADLVPALFANAKPQEILRVFLLGAAPGVAERAATYIEKTWPGVKVVDTYSPNVGFEQDDVEQESIISRVNAALPDLLVVGLGAPKQEIWVHTWRDKLMSSAVICAGATIDFLAGEKTRAPRWIQRIYLEWFFRLVSEPRRLFWRYATDAMTFPRIVWREWQALSSPAKTERGKSKDSAAT